MEDQKCVVEDDEAVLRALDLTASLSRASREDEACRLVEAFKKLIDPYQEQPELLEPHLGEMVERLTADLNDFQICKYRFHATFKFLYQLIKVTGFKSIGKKFPHDVDKLPWLVDLLAKEDPKDTSNWQTRFVLIVWLSIAIMTPFDLAKFDSNVCTSEDQRLQNKIYSILESRLRLHDSCQHVTAFCLARFFSRPDMLKTDQLLNQFISDALLELSNVKLGIANSMDDIPLIGYLRTMAYMFEFFPRTEMKARSKPILDVLLKLDIEEINRELVNHLIVKLIQRIGLSLLPMRPATWRYKCGARILGQLAPANGCTNNPPTSIIPAKEQLASEGLLNEATSGAEEIHSAESLELILNILFVEAQNRQTKIRWSAAKGIARIASRLSRERASEVIDMVLKNSFDPIHSSEFAWHGGSLTLAEMSRHGLIVEEKLKDVTRVVGEAIVYDKIMGNMPVGSHIREAACYVCWAMARSYENRLLKPYISSISLSLLCTMLFDRELQCRRAASATFQELVGRQGIYNDEGISILTNVDYQNVGQRPFTYLSLALQVASYGSKYSEPFANHLLAKKIAHWDVQIRRLAGDSLSALMLHLRHEFVSSEVLPKLISMSDQNTDHNAMHGAIVGLAKVIRGLVPLQFQFEADLIDFIGSISSKCQTQLKSRQQAPLFIEAICEIVASAEVASFNYKESSETLEHWEKVAWSALDSDSGSLREIGANAMLTLYKFYYKHNKAHQDRLLTRLNTSLRSLNESTRCGALKALARLGSVISHDNVALAAPASISSSSSSSKTEAQARAQHGSTVNESYGKSGSVIRTDAETPDIILTSLNSYISSETCEQANDIVFAQAKAEACAALVEFVRSLDRSRLLVAQGFIRAGYDGLLKRAEDYTFDKRGDIGVVVRRAAIKAIQELTLYLLSIGLMRSIFQPELVKDILARILQQAVSYNNSARELAAESFYKLIGSQLVPEIPHRDEILGLFEKFQVNDEFNWRDDSTPIFVALLAKPEFSCDLWIGLLPSVGQASDLCARQFRVALAEFIRSLEGELRLAEREIVFDSFLSVLERGDISERLLSSGLAVADYLLTEGLLNETGEQFQAKLAQLCQRIGQSAQTDPKKLISVARVMASMLVVQFSPSNQAKGESADEASKGVSQEEREKAWREATSLNYCLTLLGNRYARVRAFMAEQLYLALMCLSADSSLGENDEMNFSGAMELLSETNWSEPLAKVRKVRDQVCACLQVEPLPLSLPSASAPSVGGTV